MRFLKKHLKFFIFIFLFITLFIFASFTLNSSASVAAPSSSSSVDDVKFFEVDDNFYYPISSNDVSGIYYGSPGTDIESFSLFEKRESFSYYDSYFGASYTYNNQLFFRFDASVCTTFALHTPYTGLNLIDHPSVVPPVSSSEIKIRIFANNSSDGYSQLLVASSADFGDNNALKAFEYVIYCDVTNVYKNNPTLRYYSIEVTYSVPFGSPTNYYFVPLRVLSSSPTVLPNIFTLYDNSVFTSLHGSVYQNFNLINSVRSYLFNSTIILNSQESFTYNVSSYPDSIVDLAVLDLTYFYKLAFGNSFVSSLSTCTIRFSNAPFKSGSGFLWTFNEGDYFRDNPENVLLYNNTEFHNPSFVFQSGSVSGLGTWTDASSSVSSDVITSIFIQTISSGGAYLHSLNFNFSLYDIGLTDGYNNGFISGKNEGYSQGLTDGYNNGFTSGSEQGYNNGYSQGVQNSSGKPLATMMFTLVEVPFTFLKNTLSFDLLGVNFYNLLLGLISVGVVLWVVKKFL